MVDKPRRRVKSGPSKRKIAGVVVVALLVATVGWYSYGVLTAKPCFDQSRQYAKVSVGDVNGTSFGTFEIELFPTCAPQTVANFVHLASTGFYNDLTWHRIEKTYVIQVGDPNTKNGTGTRAQWGQGTSGTNIPFESSPDLHNYAWYVAMASTGPNVGGSSQWYVNLVNNTALDGKYAVFGLVINGTDVIQKIANVPTESVQVSQNPVTNQDEPVTPVLIRSITVSSTP